MKVLIVVIYSQLSERNFLLAGGDIGGIGGGEGESLGGEGRWKGQFTK